MKNVLRNFSFLALFLMMGVTLFAQDPTYKVRFNMNEADCQNMIVYIDLEVAADDGSSGFYISDQNYRFSFNRDAVANPRIVQELEVAGQLFTTDYSAFFDPHHLNGSLDTIISYNVVLAGGSGYPVDDTRWYPVGRIAFDILDLDACLQLEWHSHDPVDYPPTFIGEKVGGAGGVLLEVEEGTYYNGDAICFDSICAGQLPIELVSFEGRDIGCEIELIWTTASETDNDYFNIQKSMDGVIWNTIGDPIDGAGTTDSERTYRFVDSRITDIVNYYRIQQVDFDTKVTFSEQIIVKSSCYNEDIKLGITELFPNPVANDELVYIKFYTDRGDSEANIVVTDALGRTIQDNKVTLKEGPNSLSFEAVNLSPGTYFVQVRGDNWFSVTQKFVKIIK